MFVPTHESPKPVHLRFTTVNSIDERIWRLPCGGPHRGRAIITRQSTPHGHFGLRQTILSLAGFPFTNYVRGIGRGLPIATSVARPAWPDLRGATLMLLTLAFVNGCTWAKDRGWLPPGGPACSAESLTRRGAPKPNAPLQSLGGRRWF